MPRAKQLVGQKQKKNKKLKPKSKRRTNSKRKNRINQVKNELKNHLKQEVIQNITETLPNEGQKVKGGTRVNKSNQKVSNASSQHPSSVNELDTNVVEKRGNSEMNSSVKGEGNVSKSSHLFVVEPDGVKMNPNFCRIPDYLFTKFGNHPFDYYPDNYPNSQNKELKSNNKSSIVNSKEITQRKIDGEKNNISSNSLKMNELGKETQEIEIHSKSNNKIIKRNRKNLRENYSKKKEENSSERGSKIKNDNLNFSEIGIKYHKGINKNKIPCCICQNNINTADNSIFSCCKCNIRVHQGCYNNDLYLNEPSIDEEWTGKRCCFIIENKAEVIMTTGIFGMKIEGAMEKIKEKEWAHVCCVNWIPSIWFDNKEE